MNIHIYSQHLFAALQTLIFNVNNGNHIEYIVEEVLCLIVGSILFFIKCSCYYV